MRKAQREAQRRARTRVPHVPEERRVCLLCGQPAPYGGMFTPPDPTLGPGPPLHLGGVRLFVFSLCAGCFTQPVTQRQAACQQAILASDIQQTTRVKYADIVGH